ncbi:MAG TPA: hypothetical protein EYF98_16155 [Planctomycetes bacterium]|jgi:hypothetical protein|nr:hypothetical protein [Planctomycetota bacterium]
MARKPVRSNAKAVAAKYSAYGTAVSGNAKRAVAVIGKEFLKEVTEKTPRLTGAAQSSWEATRNSGPKWTTEANADKGSAGGTYSRGASKIGATAERVDITNAVGYINRLNAGSSTKAPAGFVQSAFAKALAKAKSLSLIRKVRS